MYGTPGKADNLGLTRQFLHSYFVEFEHPRTGEVMEFLAPVPTDLQDTLRKLQNRRIGLTDAGREVLLSTAVRAEASSFLEGKTAEEVDSFTFL